MLANSSPTLGEKRDNQAKKRKGHFPTNWSRLEFPCPCFDLSRHFQAFYSLKDFSGLCGSFTQLIRDSPSAARQRQEGPVSKVTPPSLSLRNSQRWEGKDPPSLFAIFYRAFTFLCFVSVCLCGVGVGGTPLHLRGKTSHFYSTNILYFLSTFWIVDRLNGWSPGLLS